MSPDDFDLPDPSEPTEEVARPQGVTPLTWPFTPLDTILLALLYLAPFAISWLTHH